MSQEQEAGGFSCFLCSQFIQGSYANLAKHFRFKHLLKTSSQERFNLICGQNGCAQKFDTFANYKYHLSVCDKVSVRIPSSGRPVPTLPCNQADQSRIESGHLIADSLDPTITTAVPLPNLESVTKSFATMTLKLRSHFLVSQAGLDFIIHGVKKILNDVIQSEETLESKISKVMDALSGLDSQFKRESYYKKNLGLKPPVEITLNEAQQKNRAVRERPGERISRLIPLTFQYFPFCVSLFFLMRLKW